MITVLLPIKKVDPESTFLFKQASACIATIPIKN